MKKTENHLKFFENHEKYFQKKVTGHKAPNIDKNQYLSIKT